MMVTRYVRSRVYFLSRRGRSPTGSMMTTSTPANPLRRGRSAASSCVQSAMERTLAGRVALVLDHRDEVCRQPAHDRDVVADLLPSDLELDRDVRVRAVLLAASYRAVLQIIGTCVKVPSYGNTG